MSWLDGYFSTVSQVANSGVAFPRETTLNFTGAGVVVSDNPGLRRTDVTITAGGGGSVPTGTGIPHVTAGVQDVAAIHGTAAGQVLAVNAGITDVAFVAVSGDATLSAAGVINVSAITGASGAGTKVALGSSLVAFALQFVAGVTAPSMGQDINTSGAGVAMSVTSQAAKVGSAANGGNLVLGGGAGDGAGLSGFVQFKYGSTVTGQIGFNGGYVGALWLGTNTSATSFALADSGGTTSVNASAGNAVVLSVNQTESMRATNASIGFSFPVIWATAATASISQAINIVGAGSAMTISAQTAKAGSAANGGPLALIGGFGDTPGGLAGAIRLQIKAANTTVLECAEVVSGNRVLALGLLANLTSTQMPANTGDGVLFLANRAIVPSANSVGGGIIYCEAGALKYRGTSGTITQLGAA